MLQEDLIPTLVIFRYNHTWVENVNISIHKWFALALLYFPIDGKIQ